MTRPNPYALEAGDRVTFTSGYRVYHRGRCLSRKQMELTGIVEATEWEEPWPYGMAYIRLDLDKVLRECRPPVGARPLSDLAAVTSWRRCNMIGGWWHEQAPRLLPAMSDTSRPR